LILVDTSVWIDHLRRSDAGLIRMLLSGQVLTHPLVVGEIAMGSLRQRDLILKQMQALPQSVVARDAEVLELVKLEKLHGLGIGFVDAHLLAAVRLTAGSRLWTRDKRLVVVAQRVGLVFTAAAKP
jgi:predicted nucleic acid-binding protein